MLSIWKYELMVMAIFDICIPCVTSTLINIWLISVKYLFPRISGQSFMKPAFWTHPDSTLTFRQWLSNCVSRARLTVYADTRTLCRKCSASSMSLLPLVMRWRNRRWPHWRCRNHQNLSGHSSTQATVATHHSHCDMQVLQQKRIWDQLRIRRLLWSTSQITLRRILPVSLWFTQTEISKNQNCMYKRKHTGQLDTPVQFNQKIHSTSAFWDDGFACSNSEVEQLIP